MEKITMKERVLRFVEQAEGSAATFTQIQRFIVDTKFGEGTYAAAHGTDTTWYPPGVSTLRERRVNPYRGYYVGAFRKNGSRDRKSPGYFLVGANRLEKGSDRLYRVIRGA